MFMIDWKSPRVHEEIDLAMGQARREHVAKVIAYGLNERLGFLDIADSVMEAEATIATLSDLFHALADAKGNARVPATVWASATAVLTREPGESNESWVKRCTKHLYGMLPESGSNPTARCEHDSANTCPLCEGRHV